MKKHVVITPNERGGMDVVVDGVNVSRWVSDTGIQVVIDHGQAYVHLPVNPVMFSGEFPDAVVNALAGQEGLELSIAEARTIVKFLGDVSDRIELDLATFVLLERLTETLAKLDVDTHG